MKLTALVVMFSASLLVSSTDEIASILSKYDDLEYSHEHSDFFRKLFAACKESDLISLTTNKNDSIATQSAWEIVTHTVPKEDVPKVYRPEAGKLGWFVGFFEGRNRITPPDWWRTIVLDARANRRNNIYPGEPKERPYHRSEIEGVKCPKNATVSEKNRVVTYRENENSVVLHEELLDRSDNGSLWCNISCSFTKDRCFVAIHDDVGYSHDVACIERNTGKVLWNSKTCGCWWGGASGIHESWVTLVPTDDGRVFVFGSASIGFYAHGFDASNGKTSIQFSNNY